MNAEASPQNVEDAGPARPAKVIKRYSNRKLYDTDRSRYVTLEEIARMIKAGDEVTIIDNESKEDLTSVTLTQIIYEEEKRESRMPLPMLRNLIQMSGSTLQEFFDRSVKSPVEHMRDSAQKTVEKRVEELKQSAVSFREAATRSMSELTESARRVFSREERKAEEFRRAFIHLFDALEERIEERIQDVRATYEAVARAPAEEGAPTPTETHAVIKDSAHVSALRERVAQMNELIDRLEATIRNVPERTGPVDDDGNPGPDQPGGDL
jgi:polyhydroxyalkanoate synthesis repressor PhaR